MIKISTLVGIGILAVGLVGCNSPSDPTPSHREVPIEQSSNNIPEDYKIADPCPPGIPTVYQRPDGQYVVRNSENHDNFTVIAMNPHQFCQAYQPGKDSDE